jgi:hypothetical protein
MGDGVVTTIWSNDFAHDDVPLGHARKGQCCHEIFEGMAEILRKMEPHGGIGSDEFFVFKEVRA